MKGSQAILPTKTWSGLVGIWCGGKGMQLVNFRITYDIGEGFGDLLQKEG